MPRCEGRPNEECPAKVNNSSVKNSQGDLMLCKDCEIYRFPYMATKSSATTQRSSAMTDSNSNSAPTDSSDGAVVSNTTAISDRKVIINELLFFVINQYDNHTKAAIQSLVSMFFREDEIMTAKQVIIQHVPTSLASATQSCTRRRIGDSKADRSVEDILYIVGIFDENDARDSLPMFCASSLTRIPMMPDDMTDMAAIRHELSDLRRQFNNLLQTVSSSLNSHQASAAADVIATQPASTSSSVAEIITESKKQPVCQADVSADEAHGDNSDQSGFSAVVKANRDQYDFMTVAGRKRITKKVIVGDSAQDTRIKGVAKKAVLCVNRLELGTTVEDVRAHLSANAVNVISCFELNPPNRQQRRFTTMRLCVPDVHLKKIYDAGIWPVGVTVRPWSFKSPTHVDTQSNNTPSGNSSS